MRRRKKFNAYRLMMGLASIKLAQWVVQQRMLHPPARRGWMDDDGWGE